MSTCPFFYSSPQINSPYNPELREEKIAFAEALTKVIPYGVILIDFLKHQPLYISPNVLYLWNAPKCGGEKPSSFVQFIKESEARLLLKIFMAYQKMLQTIPKEESLGTALVFDLKLAAAEKYERIVHHRITPINLLPNGEMWYGIGILSPSVNTVSGNVIVYQKRAKTFLQLNLNTSQWEKISFPSLNAIEKEILLLSSQGFTVNQISQEMFRSVDGIKTAKRRLFQKLKVENLQQALTLLSHRFPI